MTSVKQPRSMFQALRDADCDGASKSLAFQFLRADVTRFHDSEDFQRAYAGLMACMQVLGPMHHSYRQTLSAMGKTLSQAFDTYERAQKIWEKDEVQKLFDDIYCALEKHIPPATWANLRQTLNEITRK